MINKLFRIVALFMTVAMVGSTTSCSDSGDETDNKVPTIKIGNVQNSLTEITFTLTPTDAKSFAYACPLLADYKANNYTLTKVEGGEPKTVTVGELTPSTAYVIVAVAYNGAMVGEQKFTRVETLTEAPTLQIVDVAPVDDNVSFKLKASVGTTKIKYAVYVYIADEDPAETEKRKKWNEITEIKAEGNEVVIEKLETGVYVIEAIPTAALVEGSTVTDQFKISITSRAYVDAEITKLDYSGANLKLTKNAKCSKYYVGLSADSLFKPLTILKTLADPATAAPYLVTADYDGSMLELVKNTFDNKTWAEKAKMTLWIVPCNLDGTFSTEPKLMIKGFFAVPKRVYVYGGNATVAAEVSEVSEKTFKVALTATNCASYYVIHDEKAKFDGLLDRQIIENKLLKTTPLTELSSTIKYSNLEPGTEYMYYAVGLDSEGRVGTLTSKSITTKALEFTSSAAFTYSFVATPESATINFVPNEQCTSVRYVYMSNEEFISRYSSKISAVKNALALNTAQGMQTHNFTDAASHALTLTGLVSNQLYLFFALAVDSQNKYGAMPEELPIRTPRYDITGSASAEITGLSVRGTVVKFTVAPSANCVGCYVLILDTKLTGNDLVKAIIKNSSTVYMYDENGEGYVPERAFNQRVNEITPTSAIYVLCRDAAGKYNDPALSKTLLKK